MTQGRPLGAKLFLEGIEVPFIGATITSQVNTASIAYIDLVPHVSITNIKPRTHVMISVRDYHNKADNFPYVLAWEGEVFGYSFNKTPASRSFTINCIDYTSYWDNVLTYFFNAQASLGKGDDVLPTGLDWNDAKTSGVKIVSLAHSVTSFFKQVITDTMKDKTKDFLDGFVAVIEKIGEINDFYKSAQGRLRINDRITLKSSGALVNLLKETEAIEWFNGVIGREGGWATLRTVINDLCSILFHDSVTIPFPAGTYKTNEKKEKKIETILEFAFKPNLFMIVPPACNIFFPDEYSSFTFSRNFFREPTRLIYKPEMPFPSEDRVFLPHTYAPESFFRFMYKGAGDAIVSKSDDLATDSDPGHFNDPVKDNPTTKVKKEAQFLTNEEKFRGILMAQEGMVPASDEFRAALSQDQRGEFSKRVASYLFYKGRFQTREFSITGHLKLSAIPGFNALVIDNSDAGQNVIAYCNSVTHRIYATEGGYTTANFSYARTVQEQQDTGSPNEPLIPPWFNKQIFGEPKKTTTSPQEKAMTGAGTDGIRNVQPIDGALSRFYEALLGKYGSKSISDMYSKDNIISAVASLMNAYAEYKKKPGADVLDFIKDTTDREYVRIRDAFAFLGAKTNTADLRKENFTEFTGGSFNPKGKYDSVQIQRRQDIIRQYRDYLKSQRAFRG